jgi:UDP-3-O-[3-hydroxymyristoyl] N-acetylglucosamine deacetylase
MKGIGAHSGTECKISILPAHENHGIAYCRLPFVKNPMRADYKNVTGTVMCTKLSNEYADVSVIEHLSAAFYVLGISNAMVEVDGCEIPIMDGSSIQFANEILSVGLQEQNEKRKKIKILKTVKVGDKNRWASLSPADTFTINVDCDFSKYGLSTESVSFDVSNDDFAKDILPARTFGFFCDVEYLRKNNLALGASLENTVVFDEKGNVMNEGGLRFKNEAVRHKVLDVIGDLSMSQYEIVGKYEGFCSGHQINNLVLRELFKDKSNFEIV